MNNYKNKSDIDLIYLAKYSDKGALNELVRRYQDKVYNGFINLGLDNESSDLTQEALLKVSKSLKNLKNPEKFNSWVKVIVKNVFSDSLKHNNKINHVTNPINTDKFECIVDDELTPDENFENCELKNKLNNLIDNLSPIYKTMILLREVDGLSYDEIAKLTNMSIGTVKSRLARARIKLKNELKDYII